MAFLLAWVIPTLNKLRIVVDDHGVEVAGAFRKGRCRWSEIDFVVVIPNFYLGYSLVMGGDERGTRPTVVVCPIAGKPNLAVKAILEAFVRQVPDGRIIGWRPHFGFPPYGLDEAPKSSPQA